MVLSTAGGRAPLLEEIARIERARGIDIELEWIPFDGGGYRVFTAQSIGSPPDIVLGSQRVLSSAERDMQLGNEYVLAEDSFSMAVNLDALRRADIPFDRVKNMTVADLISVCRTLVEKGIVPIELHTAGTAGDVGTISLLQNILGEEIFGADGNYDENRLIPALQAVAELGRSGYIAVGAGYTQDTVLQNFWDGKSAFMLMWSSGIEAELKNPKNIARIAYPTDMAEGSMYLSERISCFALDTADELTNYIARELSESEPMLKALGYTPKNLGKTTAINYMLPQYITLEIDLH